MKTFASTFVILLAAASVHAADPVAKLSGPAAVKTGDPIILNPSGSVGALEFGVATGPGPAPIVTLKSDDGHTVIGFGTAAAAGTYQFYVVAWSDAPAAPNQRPAHAFAFWTVVVGDVPPTPAPGPGPGPTPPGPEPTPDPFGVTGPGAFRVLIVYESADLSKLPTGQLTALTSGVVRDYLNSHCFAGPDGRTKDWRVWDQSVNASGESAMWQRVMARPRAKIPWIVIGNGIVGYEGPLPNDVTSLLALLKKYGGN